MREPWETEGDEWEEFPESEWERLGRTTFPQWVNSADLTPLSAKDVIRILRKVNQQIAVQQAQRRNKRGPETDGGAA